MLATKSINEVKEVLRHMVSFCLGARINSPPVFLWGSTGIGKSDIVKQICEEEGIDFEDLRLTLLDPVDLRGLPRFDGGTVSWSPPCFLPQSGKGILFLDELNLAPHSVQAAAYQLILDRRVGEYVLPEGWMVLAAGNKSTDRAYTVPMPAPLANRFIHWEVETNLDDWKKWAYTNNIDPRIIGFLNFKPDLLFCFDPVKMEHAFPTPRSWERVSEILAIGLDSKTDVAGAVGVGAATEFLAYLRATERLPDARMILNGEDLVPESPDLLYSLLSALVCYAREDGGKTARVIEYACLLPEEFSVLLVRDAIRAELPVKETQEFVYFAEKHQDLIL